MLRSMFNIFRYSFLKISLVAAIFPLSDMSSEGNEPGLLFDSDEVICLELRSEYSSIQRERIENPQYHPGELIYHKPDGGIIKFSVKVSARGNFRLKPENCNFPPLSIRFNQSEIKNTIFDGQNRLKLVTPCHDEAEVIEEYIAYKIYNRITDLSFRVRLVRIIYFDTGENNIVFEKHSFFIEDDDQAAERNNCTEKDVLLTPFDLNSDNYKKLSFFQFMIGNLDWFVVSRKNILIFQPADTTMTPFAVPYDFDFSGFVNASYTKPKDIPDYLLTERRSYKGLCYNNEELEEIFDFYRDLRTDIETIIKNQKLLTVSERRYLLSYTGRFYRIIENKSLIKKEFIDKCESRKDYNLSEK